MYMVSFSNDGECAPVARGGTLVKHICDAPGSPPCDRRGPEAGSSSPLRPSTALHIISKASERPVPPLFASRCLHVFGARPRPGAASLPACRLAPLVLRRSAPPKPLSLSLPGGGNKERFLLGSAAGMLGGLLLRLLLIGVVELQGLRVGGRHVLELLRDGVREGSHLHVRQAQLVAYCGGKSLGGGWMDGRCSTLKAARSLDPESKPNRAHHHKSPS